MVKKMIIRKEYAKKENLISNISLLTVFTVIFTASVLLMGIKSLAASPDDLSLEAPQPPAETPAEAPNPDAASAEISNEAAATEASIPFTVTKLETPTTMYVTETVNAREGAGKEYNVVGKFGWGNSVVVTGTTDNGWYEISLGEGVAYIMGEYISPELTGIPYLFVGDSRTVQLQMAVGSSDKAYVAKIGEGYNWFKNTAMPQIQENAGNGTTMIINFGVNDLANASKYIKLVNNNIDAWTEAGITVYYAAVTPVGDCKTVSNDQIERFNARLQSELDPRIKWLDGYSYLKQTGFNTADGLHYNRSTYKNLYSYYMSVIGTDV